MQFITDVLVTGLVAYLSFTNGLADQILALWATEPAPAVAVLEEPSNLSLPSIPSLFSAHTIPDILRTNLRYQQAAVAGAETPSTVVTNPLDAIVNIYCTFTTPTEIRTTTGTGFFIHSSGVIMTNAHVGQYLLLGETELLGEAECFIRTGNPAVAKYRAELLYIPPAWVRKNAAVIDAPIPTGTGERDYALLFVSDPLTTEPLPAQFPALAFSTALLSQEARGLSVEVAGYPATDMLRSGSNGDLLPRSAMTTISELYTFGSNHADVFSIRGSIVGAEGSSGGPILNPEHEVIGMIVTRGDDTIDGNGSLRAITLSHIGQTIEEETGFTLERNITGDLRYRSKIFSETLSPFLVNLLAAELEP